MVRSLAVGQALKELLKSSSQEVKKPEVQASFNS